MKLFIEYAGDMDDKDVGIRTIEIEFEKDTVTEIKISESEKILIETRSLIDPIPLSAYVKPKTNS